MPRVSTAFLSLSAPFLLMVAIVGILQREGADRLQVLPALLVGISLIISGALGRRNRRKKLLFSIRNSVQSDS